MDFSTMSDDELHALMREIDAELIRRVQIKAIPRQIAELSAQYEALTGEKPTTPDTTE